jgi:hypothetical protein
MSDFPNRQIVAIYAEDWSIEDQPVDVNHAFKTYSAWVVGFLIRETDDAVTIGMELFDDRVRHAQTIPKSAIRARFVIREIS